MENVLVALTNLAVIVPNVFLTQRNAPGDVVLLWSLRMAAVASFVYHMVERKHGMPGAAQWIDPDLALWGDRVFAVLASLVSLWYVHWPAPLITWVFAFYVLALMLLSELAGRMGFRPVYIFLHCAWHVEVFLLAADLATLR